MSLSPEQPAEGYNAGTVVTLTATAKEGYTFTQWSGDTSATDTTTTVIMDSAKSVAANFAPTPTLCEGRTHCFKGSFTIDNNPDEVNRKPSTDAFDGLEGSLIKLTIAFDIEREYVSDFDGQTMVETGPATVVFLGDDTGFLSTVVAPALDGSSFEFPASVGVGGQMTFGTFNFVSPEAAEYWGIELSPTSVILRRYVTPFDMTDFASGPAEVDLLSDEG